MKRKLLLIGLVCLIALSFVPHSVHAQNSHPIVRLIYFLPKDREPQPDIDVEVDTLIKNVQQFFANEMERHGYGRKTFRIETDATDKVVVHHVKGESNSEYYEHDTFGKVYKEIHEQFNLSKDIYLVVVDSGFLINGSAGVASIGNGTSGLAVINGIQGLKGKAYLTSHELRHAFGLEHDFRIDGRGFTPWISKCTAQFMDVHRHFNPSGQSRNFKPKVNMLPPILESPPNSISLRFEITDSQEMHQVQLYEQQKGRIACKLYNGTPTSPIEFVIRVGTRSTSVGINMIDVHGNISWSQNFPIDVPALLPPAKVVSIPDTNLAAAVQREIGSITTHSMLNLHRLAAINSGITDLTGLEHAHSLETLSLGASYIDGKIVNSNAVSDFSPLMELSQLRGLFLDRINLSDVSALSGLTNLVGLGLEHNNISDVSPLASMTQLGYLYLEGNNISDISALSGLTNLTWLWLYSNNISDISALSGLTNPYQLWLHSNNISDISPLAGMTQLWDLSLGFNNISDISALSGLTNLNTLGLGSNNISDISALSGLTNLTRLDLGSNNISDISALSGLTNLTRLDLGSNNISDISALSGLTNLNTLGLGSNNISDISALPGLTNLTRLGLNNNNISDISPLAGMTQLTSLRLEGNPLSYTSINTQIPAMQATGIGIQYDQRTPTKLLIISGDAQQAITNSELQLPFVVEVQDQWNRVYAEVPVTFSITEGSGKLSTTDTATDAKGRAKVRFTLGQTEGEITIRATAAKISQPIQFTATAILPTAFVLLPDMNLATKIIETLGKQTDELITASDMLTLTSLNANNTSISNLTGLQHASNLTTLMLDGNNLSNIDPLTGLTQLTTLALDNNNISDIASLVELIHLESLSLDNNNISDIASLVELTQLETLSLENNKLSEVAPLVELTQLKMLRLRGNLLSYPSLYTIIPNLRSRGVDVAADSRIPTTLINITGTTGVAGAVLQVVVQVQDQNGVAFSGVPVNFTLTAADGHRSTAKTTSNFNGKAASRLTLGPEPGENTVSITVSEISQPLNWTITTIDPNTPVHIPDVNLHAKIAGTLNKPKNVTLNAGDMLELTRLDAPNANIQDLTGIQYAHNLYYLNLGAEYIEGEGNVNSNTVSDLSPLIGLTTLTELNLSYIILVDLSTLSDLTNLNYLWLYNNNISDVSALNTLTNLTLLYLHNNNISDVSALNTLTNLNTLWLYNNNISDISSLAGMTQLKTVYLDGNAISDVSVLSGLTNLITLGIQNNNISDVSALSGLTHLITLSLGSNNISDISSLSGLTNLTSLWLHNNNISNILSLSGLTNLTSLWLHNNNISDISSLLALNLTGTQWDSTGLYLWNNPLSYVSINTHIPALQAKGIEIKYVQRTPTRLLKISGDAQQAITNSELPLPFVVEVQDQWNRVYAEVPVTFSITEGSGKLSTTDTATDAKGRAKVRFTLGQTEGEITIRATAAKISQTIQFTATAILPTAFVLLPDMNLATKIIETLGKQTDEPITASDMLTLTSLNANNTSISNLTGLQHASNLTTLMLDGNNLSNIDPLTGLTQLTTLALDNNNISDIASLVELIHLESLSLDNNNISDIASLVELTQLETLSLENNKLSEVAPLVELTQLKMLRLRGNLLSYPSLYTAIPTLRSRGVDVAADSRIPTTLINITGTTGVAGAVLQVVVQVQDQNGVAFSGVPVNFTLTAADGHRSTAKTTTNFNGKAASRFTLGPEPGENTVSITVSEISQPLNWTITTIDPNTPVHIPDVNLHAKIAGTLNKPKNVTLNAGDMLELTRLDAPNANIQDLTGIQYAHNLYYLNLGAEYIEGEGNVNSNTVSDLSPLIGLTTLTELNLSYMKLVNLSTLSHFTNLNTLWLYNNNISDVSALNTLTNLTLLYLHNNNISDISAFNTLTNLNTLWLYNNNITDISSLTGMTQLIDLQFANNGIADVSALSGLTKLRDLKLQNNNISDISPIAGMTQMTHLSLGGNNISDISPLAGMTQMTSLGLVVNNISDISPIAGMTHITHLYLGGNDISDISPLAGMTQLKSVYLEYNDISDVSALSEWKQLTSLVLLGNPLSYTAINTHIPAMQANGVKVSFNNVAHPALHIVSGNGQEDYAGKLLTSPFVVEVQGADGKPMAGVNVSFTITNGDGELTDTTVTSDAAGRAQTSLTFGLRPGKYTVKVTATEITRSTLTFTATALETPPVAEDVNADGVVDVEDLVLVAVALGATPPKDATSRTDVNGDGAVNREDLELVLAALLEAATAAPAATILQQSVWTAENLQMWIDQAKQGTYKDETFQQGIIVLEQLLATLLPKESTLLPNYPNPFNPETWIPYQLVEPAAVKLHIYSVNGILVRTLTLGHQTAGLYHSRNRAAYWDGKNAQGEPIASGVYFYTMSAGNFTGTRKMLIRK